MHSFKEKKKSDMRFTQLFLRMGKNTQTQGMRILGSVLRGVEVEAEPMRTLFQLLYRCE